MRDLKIRFRQSYSMGVSIEIVVKSAIALQIAIPGNSINERGDTNGSISVREHAKLD